MMRPAKIPAYHYLLAMATIMISLLSSCGPSKNTALSRNYQAFITRYNIYYNGDTHFKETLQEMESTYEDDYSQMLFVHPSSARTRPQSPQPTGDFNRSIEKAQKAIQLRSIKKRPARKSGKSSDPEYKAWMKRSEYNPFLHNAWLMMGRSQYYNGDFGGAASTFAYIAKHFTWLPGTVTEARLWQARCYINLDWMFEAETILVRIKPDQLTSAALSSLYNYTYADYYMHTGSYADAVPYIKNALKGSSKHQKTRLNFLLGQIYSRNGEKALAYEAFKKAGSSSSANYRTKFNARISQSEVYTGQDIGPEVKALKKMVKYDRNKEYLDQVYYAIGNLYLSRADTANAIENYILAAQNSTRNGIEKAITQITLGNIYFDRHDYIKAQPCFSEAMPLLPPDYPGFDNLKKRSDVLDNLTIYAQNVQLQDSLLKLSKMDEDERLAVVNKIIDDLKRQEKEAAEAAAREEYLAQQQAIGSTLINNSAATPNTFILNSDNSWYFYNTGTRNAGKAEFQRRWGSRKLEDDWRRRNKATFSMSDFNNDGNENDMDTELEENGQADSIPEPSQEEIARYEDPHYPEYYLRQIPTTEAEILTSNEIIQEGLYNMGIILKDDLEDYPAAAIEFDRLQTQYPDNVYRLDIYYNMYLMAVRDGRAADAEKYRQLILKEFPESKYGIAMRDPHYIERLKSMDEDQQKLYEATYEAYLDNRNGEVHKAYSDMMENYPMSKIMPKFMFLHALAYVTERQPEKFNNVLRDMLKRYPDTDIAPIASAWLKGMAQGRKINDGNASNLRGMIWDTKLGNDSIATSADSLIFTIDPEAKQLLVLLYPTDQVQSNLLLYDVARFNFSSFVVKDFDLEQMNFGRLGMLIVRGFDNQNELDHYRKVMSQTPSFILPRQVRPIEISAPNFEALLKSGGSFEQYFQFIDDKSYTDTEENTLQEEPEAPKHQDEAGQPTSQGDIPQTDGSSIGNITVPEPKAKKPKPKVTPLAPIKEPLPPMPEYPAGSEGDDPLFD